MVTIMDNRPIGVFDSGLGGLSVIKELNLSAKAARSVYRGRDSGVKSGGKYYKKRQNRRVGYFGDGQQQFI